MAQRRYPGKNKRLVKAVLIGVFLAASTLLILFSNSFLLTRVKNSGLTVFSFFQKGVTSVVMVMKSKLNTISELRELQEAYDKAQERLNGYAGIERFVRELKKENELLRSQLDFAGDLEIEHISSEIISKNPENLFSSITINKGADEGIAKNMPVTAYQDGLYGLVGKVASVGKSSSIIMPIFSSTSFIAARLQEARFEGLANGTGDEKGYIVMKYVKKAARSEISHGDMIITSGMNSDYPKGLNIGRVEEVNSDDFETALQIRIQPVIDFSRLEYVFVITGNENA